MLAVFVAYSRLPAVRTGAILYFLLAGALTRIPLFNYLGFEFSAAMTIPAALIGGYTTIRLVSVHRRFEISRRMWGKALFSYFAINAILLLIPMLVMLLNALAVKNCSLSTGVVYYFLLPYGTLIFCIPLAALLACLFRHSYAIYILCVVSLLSHILWVTYVDPQLFAYNPILGFFPGITYDQALTDLLPLVLYREFTTVAALLTTILFFFVVRRFWPERSFTDNLRGFQFVRTDAGLAIAGLICCAILIYGHEERSDLGFHHTAADVQRGLGGVAWTKHFVLYYPLGKLRPLEVRYLKAEAEFQYGIAARRLHEQVPEGTKITVYLYPDAASKRRYIGTANTEITKPWRREIHLLLASFEDVFRHELVHVLAANFGAPIIKASTKMGFNEGLAGAIDWEGDDFSLHEYAAAMDRDGLLSNVEGLFSYTGFAFQSTRMAYTVSGSFCRYLIDRYGLKSFKAVFTSGDFFREYSASLPMLVLEWRQYLRTVDASSIPPQTVTALFLQPPIFRQICARVIAAQNGVAARAFRQKEFALAEKEFEWSFSDAPTPAALRGLFQSQLMQKKFDDVLQRFQRLDSTSSLRMYPSILLLAGDAAWLQGNDLLALRCFGLLETMNVGWSYTETAAVRGMLTRLPHSRELFGPLFYGGLSDSMRIRRIQSLAGDPRYELPAKYFLAYHYSEEGDHSHAAEIWKSITPRLGDRVLKFAAAFHAAEAFYKAGAFEKAKGMFWESKNYTDSSLRLHTIEEWIARCDQLAEALG